MIDSDIDIVYCVCVLITETSKRIKKKKNKLLWNNQISKRIKQKQIADLLYSCRAVENQKIKREKEGEPKNWRRKKKKKERKKERREKKKKERELVAGVASGPWVASLRQAAWQCEKEAKMKERKKDNIPMGVPGWPTEAHRVEEMHRFPLWGLAGGG